MGARDTILKLLTMIELNSVYRKVFFLSALTLCSTWSFGQSKTSFGSGNAAQCFIFSGNPSSLSDAKVCTDAIRYDDLSKRDLAATHTNRGIIRAAIRETPSSFGGPQSGSAIKSRSIQDLYK